jgi:hypothetical protein
MLQFMINFEEFKFDLGLLTKLLEWPTCIQVGELHNSMYKIRISLLHYLLYWGQKFYQFWIPLPHPRIENHSFIGPVLLQEESISKSQTETNAIDVIVSNYSEVILNYSCYFIWFILIF